ncbi:hypothetical protein ES702_03210 [subsurface metagenome]
MNISQPSKCFFCTFKQASKRVEPIARRRIHTSPVRSQRQRPQPQTKRKSETPKNNLKPKTLSEEAIQEKFTPAQAEAIRETQKHLDFGRKFRKGTVADTKPWAMRYFQDLTEIDPIADKPVRAPWSNLDDNSRLKTDDEFNEDIVRFMQNMPENENEAVEAFDKFLAENRLTVGKESAEYNPRSAEAPSFPTMKRDEVMAGLKEIEEGSSSETQGASSPSTKKKGQKGQKGSDDGKGEISPALIRLMQMTGYNSAEISRLRVKSIYFNQVTNQTRLGKINKTYWLSVAGNGNGLLGIGEGKSEEAGEAMIQSQYRAIRNMQPIMRYEKRTIFGEVEGKSGATELHLCARPPGSFHHDPLVF